jgi:hypothetical protein
MRSALGDEKAVYNIQALLQASPIMQRSGPRHTGSMGLVWQHSRTCKRRAHYSANTVQQTDCTHRG